ncbi:MAG: MBL fold metallo-hydrolase [Cytophagaceae bacterium]|nr:MBL fold metallo-hydrolase [Cytophagaceae bacterium]MBL0302704.1 MBL fold metallo-hydrolase [Cytophagaceae bacterium]MBL0325527.1 MBL fold metallo-hydrolase [Cytophagaceae bacterium]
MTYFFIFLLISAGGIAWFVNLPKFGKLPSGERLEKIKASKNYRDGAFQNKEVTPDLADDANYFNVLKEFIFSDKNNKPSTIIPSIKTNLKALRPDEDVLVWFGHSSYFIQTDGKKFLVDPVFSGHASPMSFSIKAFDGTDVYSADDMPEIDFLIITHDHWDHLDYETVLKLKPKIGKIICGLGVGEHLELWGFSQEKIKEKDWDEFIDLGHGFEINTVTARHFSGRRFKRNQSLWMAYAMKTPTKRIFIGGDSGYGKHFAEIGEKFGPFDLAILENGQYNKAWPYIHLLPEQQIKASTELKALRILSVHSSKFALSNHSWTEPLELLTQNNKEGILNIATPKIGEKLMLNDKSQKFEKWWRE